MAPRSNNAATVRINVDHKNRTDLVDDITLPGPLRDWQIKCVCANYRGSCNNDWMSGTTDQAAALMKPYAGTIETWEVGAEVGNVRNNRPQLMERVGLL
jgi:hypothetical protein